MARKAWLIALLATLLFTGLFVAASHQFVPWLPFAPFLYGAHPKTIQMRLGHHSAAFTLDVYGGLFESLDEDLADRFDENAPKETDEQPLGSLHDQDAKVIPFAPGRGARRSRR